MSGRARSSASWTDSSRPREGGQPGIRAPAGGTARGPATGMGRERAKPLCSRPHGDRTTVNDPLRLDRADRLLVLAPHPDDETLATGGLLQRALPAGPEVGVLFVTDGEDNPWAQRATEQRWAIGPADRERWGERRRGEAIAALECLGVSRWQTGFLGYPDQGIHRLLLDGDDDLIETLTGEIARFDPTLLVAPALEDLHPDHSALAVFVRLALARLAAGGRPRERQFVVHHDGPLPAPARDAGLTPTVEERERQRLAILCHASQLRLRRRALLGFADAQELFLAPAAPGEHDARHPVRHASVDGGVALLLELERSGRFRIPPRCARVRPPRRARRAATAAESCDPPAPETGRQELTEA